MLKSKTFLRGKRKLSQERFIAYFLHMHITKYDFSCGHLPFRLAHLFLAGLKDFRKDLFKKDRATFQS